MVTTFSPAIIWTPEETRACKLYSHSLTADHCPVPRVADFLPARSVHFPKQLEGITQHHAGKAHVSLMIFIDLGKRQIYPQNSHNKLWRLHLTPSHVWRNVLISARHSESLTPEETWAGRETAAVATLSWERVASGGGRWAGVTVNTQVSPLPPPIRDRVGGNWPMRGRAVTGTRQWLRGPRLVATEWQQRSERAELQRERPVTWDKNGEYSDLWWIHLTCSEEWSYLEEEKLRRNSDKSAAW